MDVAQAGLLAAGLGLLAFVEPCSVGSHLLFLKFLNQLPARQRLYQTLLFTLARAGLMAGLGMFAAVIGARFIGIQHGFWIALGGLYIVLGLAYLAGGAPWLIRQSDRLLPAFRQPPAAPRSGFCSASTSRLARRRCSRYCSAARPPRPPPAAGWPMAGCPC